MACGKHLYYLLMTSEYKKDVNDRYISYRAYCDENGGYGVHVFYSHSLEHAKWDEPTKENAINLAIKREMERHQKILLNLKKLRRENAMI